MRAAHAGVLLVVGILLAGSGCGAGGDNLPREPVSGKVLFGGKPLEQGTIMFLPADPEKGTPSGGAIQNGSFTIARGVGPVPGDYKVAISSPQRYTPSLPGGAEPADPDAYVKETIPPQYNTETELTAKIEKGGAHQFEFELGTTFPPKGRRRPSPTRPGRR
jgi:hypothetical protein